MKSPKPISNTFTVQHSYKLHFTQHLFNADNTLLAELLGSKNSHPVKALFVIDGGVYLNHSGLLDAIEHYCNRHKDAVQFVETIVVPGGEECKNNHENVDKILKGIDKGHIDRHSFVIAIGGGAVIDMAGYAAAIAHRGVKFIRIPTTVLAQNDAAVGVKNGINAFNKKNFVGTFAVPQAIINDSEFLKTLEQRDWISGISEAVKVALIKDAAFFEDIEASTEELRTRDMETMVRIIYRCAELHMQHISGGGDPFEQGSSRPLDFGHWAAHKLEQMTQYQLRHGEAVAIGIALDVTYAQLMGFISEEILNRVLAVLQTVGFSIGIPLCDNELDELLNGVEEFREHLGGELTITLISDIGDKLDVHTLDQDKMMQAMQIRQVSKEELPC